MGREERVMGCFKGLATGDAIGKRYQSGIGETTDDTEQTIAGGEADFARRRRQT